MKKPLITAIAGVAIFCLVLLFSSFIPGHDPEGEHSFNGWYSGKFLDRIAFPVGGLGAGMFCLEGTGAISHVSLRHKPDLFNEPFAFAAISVPGVENGAKVLEAQVPEWKFYGAEGTGIGGIGRSYGLPRFENGRFRSRFPFAEIELKDADMPVDVTVTGWSPFIPDDEDNSGLPAGAIEYTIKNTSAGKIKAIFSWSSRNFISETNGKILQTKNGYTLTEKAGGSTVEGSTGLSVFVDDDSAKVDYCWFRGDPMGADAHAMLWKNIKNGTIKQNPPVERGATGATIYVPVNLDPGGEKTIRLNFCWYFPESRLAIGEVQGTPPSPPFYKPWYSRRFRDLGDIVEYWSSDYDLLKKKSVLFRDAFYASTLPPEVIEAVAANLSILKSPTILRQYDGSLWGWEGCGDDVGSCHGSCTHVWNYAQSIAHLFPRLERSLRETEFMVNQDENGHQTFRTNLPVSTPVHTFYAAADGQLGGIMKVYREWRISGDTEWMARLFPLVRKSLDYCINTWDPREKGVLEEPHHNTYDVEFWGPDGMCTSMYLGALTAMLEMGRAIGQPCEKYETLLSKGKATMEEKLFNGKYFFQEVKWSGLKAANPLDGVRKSGITEEIERMTRQGPKYQYGKGCLSDGVIGMWMASVCGLNEVIDSAKILSHLVSVYDNNFKKSLADDANAARPTYAGGNEGGLVLCTWPGGDEPSLPFIYCNEVWTGVEYEVASHLMLSGETGKGLEIVRTCRSRYDGRIRNPFGEYEYGQWYARAMSSYALLGALTGMRYDAVEHTLYLDSKMGDCTVFLSTGTGFGSAGLRNGLPFIHISSGEIAVNKVIVSGVEKPWSRE